MNSKGLPGGFRRFGKGKTLIFALTVILGLLIGSEIGLNLWVRAALEKAFLSEARGGATRASISWIGLADVLKGRVGWVRVEARRCRVGTLEYQTLQIDNRGLLINMPALLKEKRLLISGLGKTKVRAEIDAVALQDYLNTYYPQFKPHLTIVPGSLQFSAVARVFGAALPVRLTGDLRLGNPKRLQFFPLSLMIGGRPVSGNLLRFVSDQISLQFSVLEDWPLQIVGFTLKKGYIAVDLQQDQLWGKNAFTRYPAIPGGKKVRRGVGENM